MRFEFGERVGDGVDQRFEGSRRGFSEQRLEFGEELFDGIEIGAVGRQIAQSRPGLFDRRFDAGDLVARQIVHDNDVAFTQCRREKLLHPRAKCFAVHRSVEHARRRDLIMAQRADESRRLPMTERNIGHEPFAAWTAAVKTRHFSRCAGFVDEHEAFRVQIGLERKPVLARLCDVGALLLGGVLRLF